MREGDVGGWLGGGVVVVCRREVPAKDTHGGDPEDGDGVDEYGGEDAGRAGRRNGGLLGFGVGGGE